MTYEYKSHIYLAEVVLNVKDLASQTAFYQQVLGLEILSQTEIEVILGLSGKALVHLIQTQESGEVREHYGLYHLAILLPTRKALANVLKHLTDLQIPLVGGADHGYSEALYLEDLEGNGIELYRDKLSWFPHGIFEKMDVLSGSLRPLRHRLSMSQGKE